MDDALQKVHYFVLGLRELTKCTDHKPLLKIVTDWYLNDIPNPKLCSFEEKTLQYRFMMMHVPGVKHEIPDNLSRYSVSCDGPNDKTIGADEEALAFEFTTAHNLPAVTLDRVKVATLSDKSMPQILTIIQNGFPASMHPNRIFLRKLMNTTNIEMTCTLLMALYFTKIALLYQYP